MKKTVLLSKIFFLFSILVASSVAAKNIKVADELMLFTLKTSKAVVVINTGDETKKIKNANLLTSLHLPIPSKNVQKGLQRVIANFPTNGAVPIIVITGKVTDANGTPLEGASVTLKSTKKGVTTAKDGSFTIQVPSVGEILVFSYIGFEGEEVKVLKPGALNIKLNQKESKVEEVVVLGYTTSKKKDITGSVSTVSVGDMLKAPVASFEEALGGRVAGVSVLSADGQPGDPINLVIRGASSINNSNSPLFIIDGIPLEDPRNNNLNPEDIESITVLKDASSTAIYGSRAANGVVIIITKQGTVGKGVFSYSNNVGNSITLGKVDLMNAADFVRLQYELDSTYTNTNYFNKTSAGLPANSAKPIYSIEDYERAASIDLQDKIFVSAPFQNHTFSVSGGTDRGTKYLISGNYSNQTGTIVGSGFKRYQGRINLDQRINPRMKITANVTYSATKSYGTFPRQQESMNSLANSPTNNLLYRAWVWRPSNINFDSTNLADDIFDDEQGATSQSDIVINPYISALNQYNVRYGNYFTASTITNYTFNNNFSYKLNAAVQFSGFRTEKFDNELTNSGRSPSGPNGSINSSETNNFSIENIFTFNKKLSKKSSISVIGLTSQQWRKNYGTSFSANQVIFTSLGIYGLPSGNIQPTFDVGTSEANMLGFGGSINLNLSDKYIIKTNFRADGSSKFAPGNRWGYFPSVGFAWKLYQENFMKKLPFISSAKFRANYGETGNNRINDFPYVSPMGNSNTSGFVFNNTFGNGYFQTRIGNKSLKWETTSQFDIGLEFGILSDKLTIELDFYKKSTRDLLLNAVFPSSSGFSSGLINVGKTSNQGFEVTLNGDIIDTKKFKWAFNFNVSFNRNKLLELSDGGLNLISKAETKNNTPNYISQVGQSIGNFYGFTYLGVYQFTDFDKSPSGAYTLRNDAPAPNGGLLGTTRTTVKPGDPKYMDINGDGYIDDDDQGIIGQARPKAFGGFNNNLSYKNFSLNVFFQFSYGGNNLNMNRYYLEGPSKLGINQFASYNNRWSPTNPTDYAPRAGASSLNVSSSRIIESNSYLRLKTMQLAYNAPAKLTKRIGLKTFKVYGSVQNLWTLTNYSGPDPEANTLGIGLTPGYDFSAYPRSLTYTFGVNVTF